MSVAVIDFVGRWNGGQPLGLLSRPLTVRCNHDRGQSFSDLDNAPRVDVLPVSNNSCGQVTNREDGLSSDFILLG